MNEKEAIDILDNFEYYFIFGKVRKSFVDMGNKNLIEQVRELREWLQKRADIIELASNPPEKWDIKEMPYIYELAMFMKREAHYDLEMGMVYEKMDHCLDRAIRHAQLARRYLEECAKDGK